jgi:transposase-like protein
MIFPVICPVCQSDSGRRIIPQSPEVDTFRCGHCGQEWSEPATPVRSEIPDDALPGGGVWLRLKQMLRRG